ncbi:hypothetical protein KI387_022111 [Taxus chinensis]|uniref:Lumazine-binding domain-containing protein n=1 Tax=Taxus chinensis TaxID=29808 RepID=A0AA38G1V3_TAXCH|nr:hypothetical protein KI387_022111 [Taxus chinensis]
MASLNSLCFSTQTHRFIHVSSSHESPSLTVFSNCYKQHYIRNSSVSIPKNCLLPSTWLDGCKGMMVKQYFTTRAPKKTVIRGMFTGIIEEMGKVKEIGTVDKVGVEMTIEANVVVEDVKLGDSIAVNGTCLTVTRFNSHSFTVGLSPETLKKTSLDTAMVGPTVQSISEDAVLQRFHEIVLPFLGWKHTVECKMELIVCWSSLNKPVACMQQIRHIIFLDDLRTCVNAWKILWPSKIENKF